MLACFLRGLGRHAARLHHSLSWGEKLQCKTCTCCSLVCRPPGAHNHHHNQRGAEQENNTSVVQEPTDTTQQSLGCCTAFLTALLCQEEKGSAGRPFTTPKTHASFLRGPFHLSTNKRRVGTNHQIQQRKQSTTKLCFVTFTSRI